MKKLNKNLVKKMLVMVPGTKIEKRLQIKGINKLCWRREGNTKISRQNL